MVQEINGFYFWKKGVKAKLSENFSTSEFECNGSDAGEQQKISVALINLLEAIRADFQRPLVINSGYRTAEYNARVGGATKSQHVDGTAADIAPLKNNPAELLRLLKICQKKDPKGLGSYSSWIHVDVRSGDKARWSN